jgi:hypothetical protein
LAYDISSLDKCGKILPGIYPYFGVNMKVNMLLFSPKPDMLLGIFNYFLNVNNCCFLLLRFWNLQIEKKKKAQFGKIKL